MPIRIYNSPPFQLTRLACAWEGLAGVSPGWDDFGGHACRDEQMTPREGT